MNKPPPQEKEDPKQMDADVRAQKRSIGARKLVEDMTALQDAGATKEEIEEKLKDQKAEFPKLFAMVLAPGYSRVMLNAMLDQLEAVEHGKKSTHDASVMVGTVLVNSYVRPKLGMAPMPLPN
jgi:excinuclease UvrABC ATPase subunit